ncbi:hypothetical protein CLOM_g7545, partial [Closterium sp. NIES-68]
LPADPAGAAAAGSLGLGLGLTAARQWEAAAAGPLAAAAGGGAMMPMQKVQRLFDACKTAFADGEVPSRPALMRVRSVLECINAADVALDIATPSDSSALHRPIPLRVSPSPPAPRSAGAYGPYGAYGTGEPRSASSGEFSGGSSGTTSITTSINRSMRDATPDLLGLHHSDQSSADSGRADARSAAELRRSRSGSGSGSASASPESEREAALASLAMAAGAAAAEVPRAPAAAAPRRFAPPITYLHLYECAEFSIGIFCIPASACIPLHNHPGMTVLSKLLYGRMHMRSFDWAFPATPAPAAAAGAGAAQPRLAELVEDQIIAAPCPVEVLFPTSGGNMHAFTALSPCALLDVLAPPYSVEAGRHCTYFRELPAEQFPSLPSGEGLKEGREYGWLQECQPANSFSVRRGHYRGPRVIDRARMQQKQAELAQAQAQAQAQTQSQLQAEVQAHAESQALQVRAQTQQAQEQMQQMSTHAAEQSYMHSMGALLALGPTAAFPDPSPMAAAPVTVAMAAGATSMGGVGAMAPVAGVTAVGGTRGMGGTGGPMKRCAPHQAAEAEEENEDAGCVMEASKRHHHHQQYHHHHLHHHLPAAAPSQPPVA